MVLAGLATVLAVGLDHKPLAIPLTALTAVLLAIASTHDAKVRKESARRLDTRERVCYTDVQQQRQREQ